MTTAALHRLGALPVFFLVMLAAMFIASAAAVATLTVSSTATSVVFQKETLSADSGVTVGAATISKASAAVSAAGTTSGAAVEAASTGSPTINTAITSGNWTYEFTVTEPAVNTWSSTTMAYKVEVWTDGTAQSPLYFKSATAEATAVETITVKYDLGSSNLPDSVTVKALKTAS